MSQEYDPEWVEFEKNVGIPALPADLDGRREAFNTALVEFAKNLPRTDPGIQTQDEQVSPEVKVRVYTSPNKDKKLPLVVFAHGGGWISGNLDTEDHLCRTICDEVPCVVVSVDYRIFPFVRFPTPIDDCYAAYQWAYDNADNLGADKTRFAIAGGSAGATLAIAVAYRLVSTGQGDRICSLITFGGMFLYPEAVPEQYKHLHKSYIENGDSVPVITASDMRMAYAAAPGQENVNKVEWFPASGGAAAVKNFPRTYIIHCDKEACRDDGRVLEAALRDSDVPVKHEILPKLPHYFWCFGLEKAGQRFRSAFVEGVKWAVKAS